MFCIHCGEKNPDTATFCPRCGMPLENQLAFPPLSPIQKNEPVETNLPAGYEQIPFPDAPTFQSQPVMPDAPTFQAQPVMPDAPTFQSQPSMPDAPTFQSQPAIPPITAPLGSTPSWETPSPNRPFEQFSFSEPAVVTTPPATPGISPVQAQPAPSSSGYLAGGLQSPGSPSSYAPPYQPQLANPASGTWPYMQMPAPVMPVPPPPASEPKVRAIARPLPLGIVILGIVIGAAILAALFFTGSDWAAGATRVGIVGGILAILLLLATIIRTLAGMAASSNPKRRSQFISSGLLVLILLAISGFGLTQQASIHQMQGRFFEGQQQWQNAINEFQLAGEHAPDSNKIAHTYNEWGEQLNGTQHYSAAIDKFNTVLNTFSLATSEVTRAQADNVTAYLNWGKQASQQHNYNDAITHFGDLLNLPYCNANCKAEASSLSATAYYDLAEMQLAAQQYADSANSFQTLTTLFPQSSEVQKDHADFAKALFGEGKQQLTTACSTAIPIYQELASKFSDTPEGQQATTALSAPQDVKGRFTTTVPNSSALTPMAVLAKGLFANISQSQFFQLIVGAPTVVIKSDGSFDFKSVKQGKYDLAWGTNNTDGNAFYYFSYRPSDNSLIYIANVGPLCPFDFGNINEPIPSAP